MKNNFFSDKFFSPDCIDYISSSPSISPPLDCNDDILNSPSIKCDIFRKSFSSERAKRRRIVAKDYSLLKKLIFFMLIVGVSPSIIKFKSHFKLEDGSDSGAESSLGNVFDDVINIDAQCPNNFDFSFSKMTHSDMSAPEFKVEEPKHEYVREIEELYKRARRCSQEAVKELFEMGVDLNIKDENGETLLHKAMDDCYCGQVNVLIFYGADVNEVDRWGNTPLNKLMSQFPFEMLVRCDAERRLKIARLLIAEGADLNAKNFMGWAPLHNAAGRGRLEGVELLVEQGADIEIRDNKERTPLYVAVADRRLGIAEFLVEKDADVNAKDFEGNTPLHVAAGWGSTGDDLLAELLIENGADVNVKNNQGNVPISHYPRIAKLLMEKGGNQDLTVKDISGLTLGYHLLRSASQNNDSEEIIRLLSKGVDINEGCKVHGAALHWAIDAGSLEAAETLIKNGADVNGELEHAIEYIRPNGFKSVELLVENGANFNEENSKGTPYVYQAAIRDRLEIVYYLIKKGADIKNGTDIRVKEPFGSFDFDFDYDFLSFIRGIKHFELIKRLIENGANLNAEDEDGNPLLHVAIVHNDFEGFRFLIKNGAKIDKVNINGDTPLHMAATGGLFEVAELLIENGADVNKENRQCETALDMALTNGDQGMIKLLSRFNAQEVKKGLLGRIKKRFWGC